MKNILRIIGILVAILLIAQGVAYFLFDFSLRFELQMILIAVLLLCILVRNKF